MNNADKSHNKGNYAAFLYQIGGTCMLGTEDIVSHVAFPDFNGATPIVGFFYPLDDPSTNFLQVLHDPVVNFLPQNVEYKVSRDNDGIDLLYNQLDCYTEFSKNYRQNSELKLYLKIQ